MVTTGPAAYTMFPGVFVHLNLGTGPGNGGTVGSVVNHVGFMVNNVQEQMAKWKAAGVAVLPGNNNRTGPGLRRDPGRRAHGDPGRQDPDDADPA